MFLALMENVDIMQGVLKGLVHSEWKWYRAETWIYIKKESKSEKE
jgi:hypothetical protein